MAVTSRRYRAAKAIARALLSVGVAALFVGLPGCKGDEEKVAAFMQRGDEYREGEKFKEAIIEYRNVLQIDPNHALAHERLAESYLKNQQVKEGYWELSETVRLDPGNLEARTNYAALSLAAERYDEVLDQADAILEIDPLRSSAWILKSQALLKLDRGDEAEQALLKAIEIEPEKASLQVLLASQYETRLRKSDAEAAYRRALAMEPSVIAWTGLARLLYSDPARDAETEDAFKQAIDVAREEQAAGNEKADLHIAWLNLAAFYIQRDRMEDLVPALEQGIEESNEKLDLINQLVRYHRRKGNQEQADAWMQRAIEAAPGNAEPHLMISARKAAQGDLEGALAAAESAAVADPSSDRAWLRQAEVLVDLSHRDQNPEQFERARQIVEKVLAEKSEHPEALFVQAKMALSQNDPKAAIETLRRCLDTRPNWAQAHFLLGSALILNGERPRARAELARAVELDSSIIEARRLLAQVHSQLGEHEYAIEQGRIYLRSNPFADDVRIQIAQSLVRLGKVDAAMAEVQQIPEDRRGADVHYAIGRLLAAQGKLGPARESLLKANALRPYNSKLLGTLFSIERTLGKPAESVRLIDEAVAANPESSSLAQLKGMVALSQRDLAAAESNLKRAIDLDPKNLEAYQQLAGVLRVSNRVDEAIGLYEQAVKEKPDSGPAHHLLAVLYEMKGDNEKAISHYEAAISNDDSLGESKNNLAYLLAEAGRDLDRALDLAQEAKAKMPDNPNTADTLGWVLLKRGIPSAAIGYLKEASEGAEPGSPAAGVIGTHLALAYEQNGDRDKAIATLEKTLADHDAQMKRSPDQGRSAQAPPWVREARDSIERLKAGASPNAG